MKTLTQEILSSSTVIARNHQLVLGDPVDQIGPFAGIGVGTDLDLVGLHVEVQVEWGSAAEVHEEKEAETGVSVSVFHGPMEVTGQSPRCCTFSQ